MVYEGGCGGGREFLIVFTGGGRVGGRREFWRAYMGGGGGAGRVFFRAYTGEERRAMDYNI